MKVNLDIIHSCTIKRKKTSPKFSWIGKEKENLYILDSQKIGTLDPNNGRIKRKGSKIKSYYKSIVSYSITDNGIYIAAILQNGDLIIWNKDTDTIRNISGREDLSLKLGNHCPCVFMSDDTKKIIVITSRNKVFVWECEDSALNSGNWSDIVASRDIKTVEDNKELVIDVRFLQNSINGTLATCCFIFNCENKVMVNVLRIKWNNQNNWINSSECRFETMWISHQPIFSKFSFISDESNNASDNNNQETKTKFRCLFTRGAFVGRLSHSSNLLALAINQKKVENSVLSFMSIASGLISEVDLKNFGLNTSSQGRKYWIQDLCWTFNDLYVIGITKHGAVFLISRLGQPLFIHAIGKEIDMGPALFLTLHPLIVVRGNANSSIKNDDVSINSTLDNENSQKQIYSIKQHPSLPIFVCSDGFLMCILKIQTAFQTQTRLIREMVHETIDLLNSVSERTNTKDPYILDYNLNEQNLEIKSKITQNNRKGRSVSFETSIPDWGLGAQNQSEKSSDSGVDSNNERTSKNRSNSLANQKIAEGKIIFSFLPQIQPISLETVNTQSITKCVELSAEYLVSSWSLVVSMCDSELFNNLYEYDKIAKAIQQAFVHFSYLFLSLQSNYFEESRFFHKYRRESKQKSQDDEAIKFEILINLFFSFLKIVKFDSINSHVITFIPRLIEKFIQSLIKYDKTNSNESPSRIKFLSKIYNLLRCAQNYLVSIYKIEKNESFLLNVESIKCDRTIDYLKETNAYKTKIILDQESSDSSTGINSEKIETDSLEKSSENKTNSLILVKSNGKEELNFVSLLMIKCWKNLLHYAYKYRKTLELLGSIRDKSLNEIDLFIILIERQAHKMTNTKDLCKQEFQQDLVFNFKSLGVNQRSKNIKINKADLIYFNYGNLDAAIDYWIIQLNSLFDSIKKQNRQKECDLEKKSIAVIHKIFYACLSKYEIKNFLEILEKLLVQEFNRYKQNGEFKYSKFSVLSNTFKNLVIPKPLTRLPVAIISILSSLARFISIYLMNNGNLYYYSINHPMPICSIIENSTLKSEPQAIKCFLSKEKFILSLNTKSENVDIQSIFTADKVLEIFISTQSYDEAIYFLNAVNDWKSSFLISSILKESNNYDRIKLNSNLDDNMKSEHMLTIKVCSLLGLDKTQYQLENLEYHLMEKSYFDSANYILKELLLCSVMTKSNILEDILEFIMNNLVYYTSELSKQSFVVTENFYLPAPPIYCAQIHAEDQDSHLDAISLNESKLRNKLCLLSKCFILLLTSSNLYVPLIKWYLENLVLAQKDMKAKHGIKNVFNLSLSLNNLLSSIRYQKIGYIPEKIFTLFRDFCAVLFFIDLRDKFSIVLRQYTKIVGKNSFNSDLCIELSKKLIDYGNLILGYRSFIGKEHSRIQDIVLSTTAKLTKYANELKNFDLESKLAECIEKKPFRYKNDLNRMSENDDGNDEKEIFNFQLKLNNLLEEWKKLKYSPSQFANMNESFEHKLQFQKSVNEKLIKNFGLNQDKLYLKYIQNSNNLDMSICGAFDFERSHLLADYLEIFFKFAFDQTENWGTIIQHVNNVPLLAEFYESIRQQELNLNEFRQHLVVMNQSDERAMRSDPNDSSFDLATFKRKTLLITTDTYNKSHDLETFDDNVLVKKGLFRSYSLRNIYQETVDSSNKKKSVSFTNLLNNKNDQKENDRKIQQNDLLDQPLNVLDYGTLYVQVSNLAIWLIKWSNRFQKVLIENSKAAQQFSQNKNAGIISKTTIKLNSLNANMLVGCVYLSNDNDLNWSARNFVVSINKNKKENENFFRADLDDDFTQVTHSNSIRNKSKMEKSLMAKKFNNDISPESTSLDISSYNENELKNLIKDTQANQSKISKHKNTQKNIQMPIERPITNRESSREKANHELNKEMQADTFLNTLDITEYYDFKNSVPDFIPQQKEIQPCKDQLEKSQNKANEDSNEIKNDKQKKKETRKRLGSFDFITSMFRSSRSPQSRNSKSESPISNNNNNNNNDDKNRPTSSLSISSDANRTKKTEQKFKPPDYEQPSVLHNHVNTQHSDIHQLIKDELKRIVQIQHNTVMSFLNNEPVSASPMNQIVTNNSNVLSKSNMSTQMNFENQIISMLKQQTGSSNLASEFVIETTIKRAGSEIHTSQTQPHDGQHLTEKDNYFMKNFNTKQTNPNNINNKHTVNVKPKSKFINIPLLNINRTIENSETNVTYLPQIQNTHHVSRYYETKTNVEMSSIGNNFKLLNLNHEKRSINKKMVEFKDQRQRDEAFSKSKNNTLERHLLDFSNLINKSSVLDHRNYPLLKLNQNFEKIENIDQVIKPKKRNSLEREQTLTENAIPSIQDKQIKMSDVNKAMTTIEKSTTSIDAEIQVQKPMYDGYILAPGAFENNQNDTNEKLSSAQIHFDSTKHLRVKYDDTQNKKDSATMTEKTVKENYPLPPDILFKLKFDPNKKDRQMDLLDHDFINVADLDSRSVDEILGLIEIDQKRRQEKQIESSDRNVKKSISDSTQKLLDSKQSPKDEPIVDSQTHIKDNLTEQLLNNRSVKIDRENDESLIENIKEEINQSTISNYNRNKVFNKLKFIDEKIRLMNEMADEMTNDYTKYNNIAQKISDLDIKKSQIIEFELINTNGNSQQTNQKRVTLDDQKKVKKQTKTEKKTEKKTIYKKSDSDIQIKDFTKKIIKTKKPLLTSSIDTKKIQILPLDDLNLSQDLSDLNESEEVRLKLILQSSITSNGGNDKSVENILADVFENQDLLPVKDVDLKQSVKKDIKSTKRLQPNENKNTKNIKLNRNTSPTVKKELESSLKRDTMLEKFSLQREQDAKNLLQDILDDKTELVKAQITSARNSRKTSPASKIKSFSNLSARTNLHNDEIQIPPLILEASNSNLDINQQNRKPSQPSLMAKTITRLNMKQETENQRTESLLKELEKRALNVTNNVELSSRSQQNTKILKPMTNFVRLQNPQKLRTRPAHKALTYSERLMMHQKTDIHMENSKNNLNELYKVYGSKRVKGVQKNRSASIPQRVKTYTERLKELQTIEKSNSKINDEKFLNLNSNANKKYTKVKHNQLNKFASQQRRFSPYQTILPTDIEELIRWSPDENVKRILYDDKPTKQTKKLITSKKENNKKQLPKDIDEDTLADLDLDYLNDDLIGEYCNQDYNSNQEDYVGQVNVEDLLNISLSTESAISFIDWEQLDQIIGHYNKKN